MTDDDDAPDLTDYGMTPPAEAVDEGQARLGDLDDEEDSDA